MTISEKVEELALKEYGVLTIDELRLAIVDAEFQKIIDKYIDEAKKRIIRQKQNKANKYEPTDNEVIEHLQTKLNAVK